MPTNKVNHLEVLEYGKPRKMEAKEKLEFEKNEPFEETVDLFCFTQPM
jgi:hypothetical protein